MLCWCLNIAIEYLIEYKRSEKVMFIQKYILIIAKSFIYDKGYYFELA